MAKAKYNWPKRGTTSLIGKQQDRVDGLAKATGAAKYSYDINPPNVLLARALGCPHAHCNIKSIDLSAAAKIPGVIKVAAMKKPGDEIRWQGDPIAVVVGETEGAVAEGLKAIKLDYEALPIFVNDEDLAAAEKADRASGGGGNTQLEKEAPEGTDEDKFADQEIERLLKESAAVVEGYYGIDVITHMCLEPHGATCEWEGKQLTAHLSTQNVSGTASQFATPLEITADEVTIHCDYIGGGFGSKFQADTWNVIAAKLAKEIGRPVKLMLDRDTELKTAGCRPSGYIKVRIGADKDGFVNVWDSHHWGTNGSTPGGVGQEVIPYVFNPPNRRRKRTTILTNASPTRAWRAPNHPQGCAMSQTAYDDIAAKLGMDSYDVFLRNIPTDPEDEAKILKHDRYVEEMKIAARLMDWKAKWHAHGKGPAKGSVVSGLGMAIHTWGGGGQAGGCLIRIHPDGGVEVSLGSQDLGTGTRTVINMIAAETFGLPIEGVTVNIGSSKYPRSSASGGSVTVAGVSEATRRGSQDSLRKLCELVGKKLDVDPTTLVASKGRIFVEEKADKGLSWKEACSLLGMTPQEVKGEFQRADDNHLSSSIVGGVQMAEVEVDKDTGLIRMKKFVAVQDMGLIINPRGATSQIYGAVIMGIAAALFEQRIMDPTSGAFLNAEIADYKLARLGDIGEIVVELYQPDSEYERGVVGLGEPPAISPCAAISNAVANALGVRVPVLPMIPSRVLDALKKARTA
ncbi:MAG TPA: xanthine dehydrogenase family protein molybdopterin-binding subunit [Pirellulales bacterium]